MNKFSVLTICLTIAGCATTNESIKQDNLTNINNNKDPIEVINFYQQYAKNACENYYKRPAFGRWIIGKDECIKQDSMAEKGIDFACLDSWRQGEKYYNSDECIVQRRQMHPTKVNYFDYKRFLPDNTQIQTDDKFLWLVDYYSARMSDCETQKDITTTERQSCKEYVKDTTIKIAKNKVKCSDLYKMSSKNADKYTETLGLWAHHYNNFIYSYGDTPQSAKQTINEWAKDFGKNNLCDISGWEKDMNKLIDEHNKKLSE